jgi:hypothetical protein
MNKNEFFSIGYQEGEKEGKKGERDEKEKRKMRKRRKKGSSRRGGCGSYAGQVVVE